MSRQFVVTWTDFGREPKNPPDRRWPNGVDLDLSRGRVDCCTVELDYPAARCGAYDVTCTLCKQTVRCTTAGRLDDPRSLTLACKQRALG